MANSIKKKLKLSKDLVEELTLEEIIERYKPYLSKKTIDYTIFAERVYYKHLFYFDSSDIKQIAYMGAMEAFNRYDISKNIIFYTFLSSTVDGTIQKYLYRMAHIKQTVNAYTVQEYSFDQDFTASGKRGKVVVNLKEAITDYEDKFEDVIIKEYITDLLSVLKPRERDVVVNRSYDEMTYEQIGNKHGVTKERIRQILKTAYEKIRKHITEVERNEVQKMKIKPTSKQVTKYLMENANEEITFSTAIRDYSKILGLSTTTVVNILNSAGKAKAQVVKNQYKDTSPTARKAAAAKKIESTATAIVPKEVIPAVSIATLRAEEVVENTDVFEGIQIHALTVKFSDDTMAVFNGGKVSMQGNTNWLSREELANSNQNSSKALEIYDYLYKK